MYLPFQLVVPYLLSTVLGLGSGETLLRVCLEPFGRHLPSVAFLY